MKGFLVYKREGRDAHLSVSYKQDDNSFLCLEFDSMEQAFSIQESIKQKLYENLNKDIQTIMNPFNGSRYSYLSKNTSCKEFEQMLLLLITC